MTKLHRKELKQDEIRETVMGAVQSASLHSREIIYILAIVVAVGLIAFAWFTYERGQQQKSQSLLGQALRKYNSPVGNSTESEVKPEFTFQTDSEKYAAAIKDFEQVAQEYGNTPAASMARYMTGICAFYLNDFAKAEDYLQKSTKVSDRSPLFYQSRIALAEVYTRDGKVDQAVHQLQECIQQKSPLVPADYLLFRLGSVYEQSGKVKEARETYQKILNEHKESPLQFQVQQKLTELNKG